MRMVIRRTGASALLLWAGPVRLIKSNRLFAREDRMSMVSRGTSPPRDRSRFAPRHIDLLRPQDLEETEHFCRRPQPKVGKIVHCGEPRILRKSSERVTR